MHFIDGREVMMTFAPSSSTSFLTIHGRFLLAPLIVILTHASTAVGDAIMIDPGPSGSTFTAKSFSFGDLNGVSLDGSQLSLDLIFSPKHIEFRLNGTEQDAFVGSPILADISLFFESPLSQDSTIAKPQAFLSDETGAPLVHYSQSVTTDALVGRTNITYIATFFDPAPVPESLIFHDVHFSIQLPDDLGNEISGASMLIGSSQVGDVFTDFVVGEWQPVGVPEPASIALWSVVGLVGCFGKLCITLRRLKPSSTADHDS
jgi:hypothetical protein